MLLVANTAVAIHVSVAPSIGGSLVSCGAKPAVEGKWAMREPLGVA